MLSRQTVTLKYKTVYHKLKDPKRDKKKKKKQFNEIRESKPSISTNTKIKKKSYYCCCGIKEKYFFCPMAHHSIANFQRHLAPTSFAAAAAAAVVQSSNFLNSCFH